MPNWSTEIWIGLAGLLTTVLGFVFTIRQLVGMRRARAATALSMIFEILEANGDLWRSLPEFKMVDGAPGWTDEQQAKALKLARGLNRVGLLCETKLVDPEYVMVGWARVYRDAWRKMEPLIKHRRTHGVPEYVNQFENFAKRSERYLADRFPGT